MDSNPQLVYWHCQEIQLYSYSKKYLFTLYRFWEKAILCSVYRRFFVFFFNLPIRHLSWNVRVHDAIKLPRSWTRLMDFRYLTEPDVKTVPNYILMLKHKIWRQNMKIKKCKKKITLHLIRVFSLYTQYNIIIIIITKTITIITIIIVIIDQQEPEFKRLRKFRAIPIRTIWFFLQFFKTDIEDST